jgi:hypothetical protein
MWRVVVCDQETSKTTRLKPATGLWKIQPRWVVTPGKQTTNKHGKSTPMTLRKITFEMGQQGQKSKRPHDTMPISLTANFAKIRSMVYDTDLTLKTTDM